MSSPVTVVLNTILGFIVMHPDKSLLDTSVNMDLLGKCLEKVKTHILSNGGLMVMFHATK